MGSDTPEMGTGRYRRNLFTGEIEYIIDDPQAEFAEIREKYSHRYAHAVTGRRGDPWDKGRDVVNRNMSIPPEQATPERIAAENAKAKRHGTGAYYTSDGECRVPTRGALNKELKRRRLSNLDAGYGDHCTL